MEGVGKDERPPVGANPYEQLVAVPVDIELGFVHEGNVQLHGDSGLFLDDAEGTGSNEILDRVSVPVQLGCHKAEPVHAHHLVVEEAKAESRNLSEGLVNDVQVSLLDGPPAFEVGIGDHVGKHPVDHHRIDSVSEKAQVAVGPAGLVDHHLLRIHHQAGGGDVGTGHQLPHLFDPGKHRLRRDEDLVFGHRQICKPGQQGSGGLHQTPLGGHHLLEIPGEDLGKGEQAKGLGRRSTVDDEDIELTGAGVTVYLQQGEQLVHPGEHQKLLGLDPGRSTPVEHVHELASDRPPIPVELTLGVDLLTLKTFRHLGGIGPQRCIESVGQRMGRVRRGDQGPVPGVGRGQGGGRGHRGLAHSPFTCDQDYPQGSTHFSNTLTQTP